MPRKERGGTIVIRPTTTISGKSPSPRKPSTNVSGQPHQPSPRRPTVQPAIVSSTLSGTPVTQPINPYMTRGALATLSASATSAMKARADAKEFVIRTRNELYPIPQGGNPSKKKMIKQTVHIQSKRRS